MDYTTELKFKITASTASRVGIGLGQHPDSSCQLSNFPNMDDTWYQCTETGAVCKKSSCMFGKLTGYLWEKPVESAFPTTMEPNSQYTWQFIPPLCPSTNKCWKIKFIYKDLNGATGITGVNLNFECSRNYLYQCGGSNLYAMYFELTSAGTATIVIETTICNTISNCIKCPSAPQCQQCAPTFTLSGNSLSCGCSSGSFLNLAGNACITVCPARSFWVSGQCQCGSSFVVSGNACVCSGGQSIGLDGTACITTCPDRSSVANGQCVCNLPFLQSGNTCGCGTGSMIDISGTGCVSSCPAHSVNSGGQCQCTSPFVVAANSCACPSGQLVSLDGSTCVTSCPARSSASNFQCACNLSFVQSGNICGCSTGKILDVSGTGCVSSCPARSSDFSGQCTCNLPFFQSGNTCGCSTGNIINLSGTGCVSSCSANSVNSGGQCQCKSSFVISGNSCVCGIGQVLSLDGSSCIASCPLNSQNLNGQCVCDNTFVINGNACGCGSGKLLDISGTSCVSSCPRGALKSSGKCQCSSSFIPNGNSCGCSNSNHFMNIDASACVASCPQYSQGIGEECICDSGFISKGDSCGCSNGKMINLAGTGCISSCPSLSSSQNGKCQCMTPFISSPDQASCICPVNLKLSLDKNSCTNSCPDHTIIENEACICDSKKDFITSSDKLSCECKPQTVFDSNSQTCKPKEKCSSSCLTCSGPNPNECLACYSGYELSSNNTCDPSEETSTSVTKAAKATRVMSSTGIVVFSAASKALRFSLLDNIFQYLKFMDISYPSDLDFMLKNQGFRLLPFEVNPVKVPDSATDRANYKTLDYQFTKYEDIHPGFLANFWKDIWLFAVLIACVSVFLFLQKAVFDKEKSLLNKMFFKARLLAMSFLIIFVYNSMGKIIFYGILDFRSAKSYSGVFIVNLILAIFFFIVEIFMLISHYNLLGRYQKINKDKQNPNRSEDFKKFLGKYESVQALFDEYKDSSLFQQGFLLILVLRDLLSNLVLVTLFDYPIAQTACFMALSWTMVFYIFCYRPFKRFLNALQQFLYEIILLVVNSCVFINALLDSYDDDPESADTKNKLGLIIVRSNLVFYLVSLVFLMITVWSLIRKVYQEIQANKQSRKVTNFNTQGDLTLRSEAEKTIIKDVSSSIYPETMGDGLVSSHRKMLQNQGNEDIENLGSPQKYAGVALLKQKVGNLRMETMMQGDWFLESLNEKTQVLSKGNDASIPEREKISSSYLIKDSYLKKKEDGRKVREDQQRPIEPKETIEEIEDSFLFRGRRRMRGARREMNERLARDASRLQTFHDQTNESLQVKDEK